MLSSICSTKFLEPDDTCKPPDLELNDDLKPPDVSLELLDENPPELNPFDELNKLPLLCSSSDSTPLVEIPDPPKSLSPDEDEDDTPIDFPSLNDHTTPEESFGMLEVVNGSLLGRCSRDGNAALNDIPELPKLESDTIELSPRLAPLDDHEPSYDSTGLLLPDTVSP